MKISPLQFRKFRIIAWTTVLGTLLGLAYIGISDGFSDIFPILNGLLTGTLSGFLISGFEMYFLFERKRSLRFGVLLGIRTLSYATLVGLVSLIVSARIKSLAIEESFFTYLGSDEYSHWLFHEDFPKVILFSLIFGMVINLIMQVSRKMGPGRLITYMFGRYHNPRSEEWIFMFLDLKSSVTIAEKLGHLQFHKFVNTVFTDIAESILLWEGGVYQYVGDEVVLNWKMKKGIKNANCIRCFYEIKATLEKEKEKYLQEFGVLPQFKAGLHGGTVTVGEVGDLKMELAFLGDVVNTTARLEGMCNKLNEEFLISESFLNRLDLPPEIDSTYKDELLLKGKTEGIKVYAIRAKQTA